MERLAQRLLLVLNSADYFLSHRLPVALAAKEAGYEVHVATPPGPNTEAIVTAGLVYHAIPLSRSSMNPISELQTLSALFALFRAVKPNIVHLVTIKPVLYGGTIARMLKVPSVVIAISGLGFVFLTSGAKAMTVRGMVAAVYRFVFGNRRLRVIVQNADDCEILVETTGLQRNKVVLIRGSGVDLSVYEATSIPQGTPVVVMAARLLGDKGVREFVSAARIVKSRRGNSRFWLVGSPDPGNPASVSEAELLEWANAEVVEVLGQRDDIPRVFSCSSVVVLPSYREGLPKVLIEAAACARPVVTTDVPGCRDAVLPGITGLLVTPRNAVELAEAIDSLLGDPEKIAAMGRAGRQFAEREFSLEKVIAAHLAVYTELNAIS